MFILSKGYTLVTEIGYCGHVSGEHLTTCSKTNVTFEDICQAACTSSSLCLAYEFHGDFVCDLIPSSPICPDDYKLYNNTLAKNISEIHKIEDVNFVCYTKASGKCLEIVETVMK